MTWIVIDYPWPGDEISGIFHRTQARALVAAGASIRIAVPTPWAPQPLPLLSEKWRGYARAPRRQSDGPVEIRRCSYLAVPGEPAWAANDRVIAAALVRDRGLFSGVDLIHAHFATPNGMAAMRIAPRVGVPYVVTVHGYDLNTWPDRHPNRRTALAESLRRAARVIAVSDALRARVFELSGVDAISLPLGVDVATLEGLRLPRAEARHRLGLPEDRFVALFIARLMPHKGIREFVDAVLDAPSGELPGGLTAVVVGDGPLRGYRADERLAAGRLSYVGPQPTPSIATYMSAADVQILPSFSEGLPTVLVEAGAVGVPVIGSRAGGIPQLLGTDRGILLDEVTPAAIRAALRASADRSAAEERARRLNRHVHERYDVFLNAERLRSIYMEVIAERSPR